MTATEMLVWGLVVHLVCDWLGQNDWMSRNKANRRLRSQTAAELAALKPGGWPGLVPGAWWDRHPAAYVHAGIHALGMALVFPWWAALAIGVSHFLIDLRTPIAWWSRLIRQTQPGGRRALTDEVSAGVDVESMRREGNLTIIEKIAPSGAVFTHVSAPLYDIGTEVRIWTDQVAHVAVVAVTALAVAA